LTARAGPVELLFANRRHRLAYSLTSSAPLALLSPAKNDTCWLMERERSMPLFAADIVPDIPDRFWTIPYDIAHDRNSATLMGIETGANCQNFAYELLRHFGRQVPHLRSSNLWDDTEHTIAVDKYQPLDLLLFNPTHNAWGAHVAVYVGNDRAIHLSRRVGLAAVWPLAQFAGFPEYRVLLGGKRALATNSNRSF
jgi:hypothetical protein